MDKKLYVTVGCPGSGKETWVSKIRESMPNEYKVISRTLAERDFIKDNGRKWGSENEFFTIILEELERHFKNEEKNIIIKDDNLIRSNRKKYYDLAKKYGYEVLIVMFLIPLDEIHYVNNSEGRKYRKLPEQELEDKYKSLQIPKCGLDCDKFIIQRINREAFFHHINNLRLDSVSTRHKNPNHLESVYMHISANEMFANIFNTYGERWEMGEIARYHDLGKMEVYQIKSDNNPETIWYKENYGDWYTHDGHEKLSALYHFIMNHEDGVKYNQNNAVSEAIYHHTNREITQKYIDENKITEYELHLIDEFRFIDLHASIPNKHAIENIDRIKKENKK